MASALVFGKAKGEPRLRVVVHQDAGEIAIDANQFLADPVRGIDSPQEPLKIGAGDGSLIFLQQFPLRRIGQGIAEAVRRTGERGGEEEEEEERWGEEDPWVKMR